MKKIEFLEKCETEECEELLELNDECFSIDEFNGNEIVEESIDEYIEDEVVDELDDEEDEYIGDEVVDELDDEENERIGDEIVDELDDEEYAEEDDLFICKYEKRKSKLPEGDYIAEVKEIKAERQPAGQYGSWTKITLIFEIINPKNNEKVEAQFISSNSLYKKSKLYPIVKGILGAVPGENLNLSVLKGKKTIATIKHNTDENGNVWDNVVATRYHSTKKRVA